MSTDTRASAIEKKYRARTPKSATMAERAARVMPGGETRNAVYHPPYSLTLDHGRGPRCWDIDGNDYIDLHNNYTALIHGHAFEPIVQAAHCASARGSTWAAKAEKQVELAELIAERVDSVEQVRFSNSGTEAVLSALAVARACTGRNKFLFPRYGFHGHLLDASTPQSLWLDACFADFGDAESFEQILAGHKDEIAAVVMEPILGAGGLVEAQPAFFERVKAAAHRAGALFILDEATVFRVTTGGAQKRLNIKPDISVLGKFVGGGYPCGTIGGSREIMAALDPQRGKCSISGTFSGNQVTMAAGVEALRHFTEADVDKQVGQVTMLEEGLKSAAERHGLPLSTRRAASLLTLYFSREAPAFSPLRNDTRLVSLFQLACMNNGVFINAGRIINTPTSMTDGDLKEVLERLDTAMGDLAKEA